MRLFRYATFAISDMSLAGESRGRSWVARGLLATCGQTYGETGGGRIAPFATIGGKGRLGFANVFAPLRSFAPAPRCFVASRLVAASYSGPCGGGVLLPAHVQVEGVYY